eukprot:g6341.t1
MWASEEFRKRDIPMRTPSDWLAHYNQGSSKAEHTSPVLFRYKPGTDPHLRREYKNPDNAFSAIEAAEAVAAREKSARRGVARAAGGMRGDGEQELQGDNYEKESVSGVASPALPYKMETLEDWKKRFGAPERFDAQMTACVCRDKEQDFAKLTVTKMKQKFSVFFGKRIEKRHPEMRTLPSGDNPNGIVIAKVATKHPNQAIKPVETLLQKHRKAKASSGGTNI